MKTSFVFSFEISGAHWWHWFISDLDGHSSCFYS